MSEKGPVPVNAGEKMSCAQASSLVQVTVSPMPMRAMVDMKQFSAIETSGCDCSPKPSGHPPLPPAIPGVAIASVAKISVVRAIPRRMASPLWAFL